MSLNCQVKQIFIICELGLWFLQDATNESRYSWALGQLQKYCKIKNYLLKYNSFEIFEESMTVLHEIVSLKYV